MLELEANDREPLRAARQCDGLRSSTVTWSTEEDATQGAGKPGAAGTATQGNARARTRRATSGVKTTTGRLAGFRFVSNSCAILIVKFN